MSEQENARISHTRILLYLVALSAVLAVGFHIIGHSQRAWNMSIMVGYGLVLVAIFKIGDFIVYRYLVGDGNGE